VHEKQRTTNHDMSADGLRGIASLNVTIHHFIAAFFPSVFYFHYPTAFTKNINPNALEDFLQFPFISLLYNGHFAVMVFFALSGYVLSMPYWSGEDIKIKRRLWARYLRLNIPIAFSIVISYCLFKFGFYKNIDASALSGSNWLGSYFEKNSIWSTLALKSIIYDSIFNGENILNPPLWTLRIEFIGSIYLLVYYSIKPHKHDFIFLIICSFILYYFYKSDAVYYITILIGGWLGGVKLKHPLALTILFFLGLYFGSFVFENKIFDWLPNINIFDSKNFYNAMGACFIVASIINGYGKKFFSFPVIQFLGRISFSLYLLHFLILCSLACSIYIFLPINILAVFLNLILYLCVSMFLAKIFTKYIDKASVSISRKFSYFLFKKIA